VNWPGQKIEIREAHRKSGGAEEFPGLTHGRVWLCGNGRLLQTRNTVAMRLRDNYCDYTKNQNANDGK
jgi:hypothetical protein